MIANLRFAFAVLIVLALGVGAYGQEKPAVPGTLAGPATQPAATPAPESSPATQPTLSEEGALRVKLLKADLDNFTLDFTYYPARGGDWTDYPSLTLRVPAIRDKRRWPAVQLTAQQAGQILDLLAATGCLDRAECTNDPYRDRLVRPDPVGPVYVLSITAAGWTFQERLTFNAQTYWRLLQVQSVLAGNADATMEKTTLVRLAEKQPKWKRAGDIALGLQKELRVELNYVGPERSVFPRVEIHSGIMPPKPPAPGQIWISPAEVAAVTEGLAAAGVLESLAMPKMHGVPGEQQYLLVVGNLEKPLGWDAAMRTTVETIRERLADGTQLANRFDELLEKLEQFRAEWDKAAGLKAAPIDWDKAGDYSFGPWKYVYRFSSDRQGKIIGHWGYLYYRGLMVDGIELNDFLQTPWGRLHWVGIPQMPNGPHGWMKAPNASLPAGHEIPSPLNAVGFQRVSAYRSEMLIRVYFMPGPLLVHLVGPDRKIRPDVEREPVARLTMPQIKAALANLAYTGVLGTSVPGWPSWDFSPVCGLEFCWPEKGFDAHRFRVSLGTRDEAIKRVAELKSALDGKPAETLGEFLKAVQPAAKPALEGSPGTQRQNLVTP